MVDKTTFHVSCCSFGVHYRGVPGQYKDTELVHPGMHVKLDYLADGSIVRIEQL
jgi:hypothetical protein